MYLKINNKYRLYTYHKISLEWALKNAYQNNLILLLLFNFYSLFLVFIYLISSIALEIENRDMYKSN